MGLEIDKIEPCENGCNFFIPPFGCMVYKTPKYNCNYFIDYMTDKEDIFFEAEEIKKCEKIM